MANERGKALKGALAAMPSAQQQGREKAGERLSPGVYRGSRGGLVTASGRPIPRPQTNMAQQVAGGGRREGMANQVAGGMQGGMAGQIAGQYNAMNPQMEAIRGAGGAAQYGDRSYQMSPEQAGMAGTIAGQQFGGELSMEELAARQAQFGADAQARQADINRFQQFPINDLALRYPANQAPGFPKPPEASANMGGRYRLSPGVYGTREQAMRQYEQQMQQYNPALMGQAGQAAMEGMQGGGNSGAGSFPMQQRERELGYAENRFNAAKDNNLFRGNPIRRFRF